MSKIIVLMGVSGSGKTTVGELLSLKMRLPFLDADAFHPKENIEKMSSGNPLNDDDRKPWLEILNTTLTEAEKGEGAILACSALKENYRKILAKSLTNIHWVYLKGDFELIKSRMENRGGHFMRSKLLQSQFDCLEVPKYGLTINIEKSPDEISQEICDCVSKQSFGILGLGVMGKSLALNLLNNQFSISVYNRETKDEQGIVQQFLDENINREVKGFTNLQDFVESLERPRKILMMVKAGDVTDKIIGSLVSYLEEDDILIDGGNSHYKDTARREAYLEERNIHFIGLGVSGGEEGALKGPSLMPGGKTAAYEKVAPFLETIAAKDISGKPCCAYIGPQGAGHFVKMVHNGIEYGDMQLLAELYDILSKTMDYQAIADVFSEWNQGELSSYLLEITSKILEEKEGDTYLLDQILDKAGNKGTGSWSSIAAMQLGMPTSVKTAAVYARYTSSFKEERVVLARYRKEVKTEGTIDLEKLKQAYDFARTINLHQGLALIKTASEEYEWNLNLSEICRVWSNGCIIKSEKVKEYSVVLQEVSTLLEEERIVLQQYQNEQSITEIIAYALQHRIQIPCFYEAYNYWIAMTTEKSSANLIQAQRDFFGAHRFRRIDKDAKESFHHNWS